MYLYTQLSLNDNKLTGDLESVCSQCPEVSHIGLAGNRINGLDELKPLVSAITVQYCRDCTYIHVHTVKESNIFKNQSILINSLF